MEGIKVLLLHSSMLVGYKRASVFILHEKVITNLTISDNNHKNMTTLPLVIVLRQPKV